FGQPWFLGVNHVEMGIDIIDQPFERGHALLAHPLSVQTSIGLADEVEDQTHTLWQVEVVVQSLPVAHPDLVDSVFEFRIVPRSRSRSTDTLGQLSETAHLLRR